MGAVCGKSVKEQKNPQGSSVELIKKKKAKEIQEAKAEKESTKADREATAAENSEQHQQQHDTNHKESSVPKVHLNGITFDGESPPPNTSARSGKKRKGDQESTTPTNSPRSVASEASDGVSGESKKSGKSNRSNRKKHKQHTPRSTDAGEGADTLKTPRSVASEASDGISGESQKSGKSNKSNLSSKKKKKKGGGAARGGVKFGGSETDKIAVITPSVPETVEHVLKKIKDEDIDLGDVENKPKEVVEKIKKTRKLRQAKSIVLERGLLQLQEQEKQLTARAGGAEEEEVNLSDLDEDNLAHDINDLNDFNINDFDENAGFGVSGAGTKTPTTRSRSNSVASAYSVTDLNVLANQLNVIGGAADSELEDSFNLSEVE